MQFADCLCLISAYSGCAGASVRSYGVVFSSSVIVSDGGGEIY